MNFHPRISCCFALLFLAGTLPAAELLVPRLENLNRPGAIIASPLPWQEGFTVVRTRAVPEKKTRFKIAHDNKNLYIGLEAHEDMSNLSVREYPDDHPDRWRNDAIEIDFDPDNRGVELGKIIIDASGKFTDYRGVDDNTGTGRYICDTVWESRLKVLSAKQLSDRWTLELALPLGAFFDGNPRKLDKCRFNIARVRVKTKETSSLAPLPGESLGVPKYYPKLILENFDLSPYEWQISGIRLSGQKIDGKPAARVTAKLWNLVAKWQVGQCRVTVLSPDGSGAVSKSAGIHADAKQGFPINMILIGVQPGRCRLYVELLDTAGNPLAGEFMRTELELQPVRIRMISPSYRDSIYATQKLTEILAEIRLEEEIGKPLDVTLTGPNGFSSTVKFPAAMALNPVSFPFVNMPEGNYLLSAGGVTRTIRKLPPFPQEVRLDEKNAMIVNGKLFLPNGYFSINPDWYRKGINIMVYFKDNWKNPDEIRKYLDRFAAAGLRGVIYPYMEPAGEKSLFADTARQGSRLTDAQREAIGKAVEVCKNHPGFLAYYAADEPEGHNHSESWYEDLYQLLRELDPAHPAVITNYGLDGQRRFHRGCDILISDAYPDYFEDNSNTQPRSVSYSFVEHATSLHSAWLAVQFFDWGLKNPVGVHGRSPTYDEVREQIWMSLLANSKGFAYYLYCQGGAVSNQMRGSRELLGLELDALKEVILQPTRLVRFSPALKKLRAGLKVNEKDFALIAVNSTDQPVNAQFMLELPANTLAVSGENRSVKVENGRFSDTIPPHTAYVYLSEKLDASSVDHQAIRADIRKRDKDRKRPGNLAAAGELSLSRMKEYKQGIIPAGVPKISVSSQVAIHNHVRNAATQYFLQDGIRDTEYTDIMTWTPLNTDQKPWIEIDFGKEVTAGRMVFYLFRTKAEIQLKGGTILTEQDGKLREIAAFSGNRERCLEVRFAPVKTRKLRIELTDFILHDRLLDEIEVYNE